MKQLLIFEGISGSGKTTLLRAINKRRGFEDYHIHRLTATNWVYAMLNDRSVDLAQLHHFEREIQKMMPTTVVFCRCDPHEALKRKAEMKDEDVEDQIGEAQKLFEKYFEHHSRYERVITLDTDITELDRCVDLIYDVLISVEGANTVV